MKGQFLVVNCKGFQGVSLNGKLMNWSNCRSIEGDPPPHPKFDLRVIELHSGFTFNSRRLTGSLRPKTSLSNEEQSAYCDVVAFVAQLTSTNNLKQVTSKHSTFRIGFKI